MNAKPEDLSLSSGITAYGAISQDPERRARNDIAAYVSDVEALHKSLSEVAHTDAQRSVVEAQVERYREGYIRHQNAMWSAQSRCMSAFITGPSNFPTRRNEKRMATERRRTEEFIEWRKRARAAAHQAVSDARTGEQVANDDWSLLQRAIDRDMATVAAIDAGKEPYSRSAFTGSVQGKLERLARNGEVEIVRRALDYIRERQATMPKPFFAARNSVWQILGTAEASAAKERPTGETLLAESNGVRLVNNHDAERVQLLFPGKPSDQIRTMLKGMGFRWSPMHGAWQRQNTPNGIAAATGVLGRLTEGAAA